MELKYTVNKVTKDTKDLHVDICYDMDQARFEKLKLYCATHNQSHAASIIH